MSSLLNPAWHALTSRHQPLGLGNDHARRYLADVVPIAAIPEWSTVTVAELIRLFEPGETLWLVNAPPGAAQQFAPPGSLREMRRIPCHQMFFSPGQAPAAISDHTSVALDTEADARDMVTLTDIAFPGFFRIRSPRMGPYRGIRVDRQPADRQLVAMAGTRLAWTGHREVSAVCTHPEHTGRGYARQLVHEVAEQFRREGDVPLLHVSTANARAIAVYQHLGFVTQRQIDWVQFQCPSSA